MTQPAKADRRRSVGIVLPTGANPHPRQHIDRAALGEALEAGHILGFVSRDPIECEPRADRRRPGPRRREPQDRLSVPGPKRITAAFRKYCTTHGLTHWEGLERLMEVAEGGAADEMLSGMESAPSSKPPAPNAIPYVAPTSAGRAADRRSVALPIVMPVEMRAWVEARGGSARYDDASDYVRDAIRRDQESRAFAVEIEAALDLDTTAAGGGAFDITAFLRERRNEG